MLDIKPIALVAQLVNFAIFLWVINYFIFRPIRETLRRRKEEIKGTYDALDAQKRDVDAMRAEIAARLANIEGEIAEMKRQAIRDAQAQKDDILKEAAEQREKVLEKARVTAENETLRVIGSLRDHVSKLSLEAAGQILQRELDAARHLEVVDRVLKEAEKTTWRTK